MTILVNSFEAWLLASRPKTLGAIICPVLIGSSLAFRHNQFDFFYFVLTLLCSVFLQILANLVNDYGDFIKGSDQKNRLGPPRAMQMGFITEGAMLKGIVLVIFIAVFLGFFLVKQGGTIVFVVGTLSLFLCLWYTLGKKPLAYLGFAEIIIFIVFGPLSTLATFYVQTNRLSADLFFLSLSPGFLSAALLLTNNVRDVVEDKKNNKLTIAVRFGDRWARFLVLTLLNLALCGPVIAVFYFSYSPMALLPLLALLFPMRYFPMIWREPISPRFNLMLISIGQALYLFGIMMSIGILYGAP